MLKRMIIAPEFTVDKTPAMPPDPVKE